MPLDSIPHNLGTILVQYLNGRIEIKVDLSYSREFLMGTTAIQ